MRLRLAMIAIVVLVVSGVFILAHERATAEHIRVALFDAAAAEPAAAAPPAGAGAVGAPTPLGAPATASADVVPAPPGVAPAAPGTTPAAGFPATISRFGAAGAAPGVTVQVGGPQSAYYTQVLTMPPPGDDPETNELTSQDQQIEQEVQSLARQLADSDDKQRGELKDKLAAALEKQFDVQQKLRQIEISRIEARVQKLRDLVRKRTESRRKIIDNRFEQLLNDADGLGWNSAKGGGIQVVPQSYPSFAPRAELPLPLPPPTPTAKRS
ncbi:MAG TPA: hypothetical protein VG125_18785 [Pirellulales bacterium]|jgi:hypothetical protein|nr:hypothetical protein [Pirellulales bacterium]